MAKKSRKKVAKAAKAAAKKSVPEKVKTPTAAVPQPPPATRKSSVIMLSSAENSFEDASLILNEQSISIIDLARPSTRLSNVEMDMTDVSDPRFSAHPAAGDETDLSLTNIVQTPGVHRERPKSSWVMRRTRSKSVAPPQEDNPPEGVTRRARSIRPPARFLERIDEIVTRESVAVTKRPKSKKAETPRAQRNSERVEPVTPALSRVTTRRRNVTKSKVDEDVTALQEVQQSLAVSSRRQEVQTASNSQTDEDSNKSLETTAMSMVSVRRRRAFEKPISPEEPAPMTSPAPTIRPRTRSASRGRQPAEPAPTVRPRTRSASRGRQSTAPTAVPESATRPKRATKKISKCPCCVNGDNSRHEDAPAPTRGRSRTRTTSEVVVPPARSRSKEPKVGRTRSKSVIREPAPKTPPARSKSVSREPAIHVPVYRQPIEPPAVVAAKAKESDVYAFDSPGLLGMEAESEGGKRKRKGSVSQKRPNVSSRGKRTTPAKKAALAIFGTDMKRIGKVLNKIGGGPVKQPAPSSSRPASPVVSNYDPVDDHHDYVEDDVPVDNENLENLPPVIVPPSPPKAPPPANKVNPLIERVLQQRLEPATPDHSPAQANVTLSFSPLGASSPWRIQNENVLPRTFYFSRSKDLLPSYESDVVIRDENVRPKTPVIEPEPVPRNPSPAKRPSPAATAAPAPISGAKADDVFRGIQKSYEQLKVTSEMSNKLITAMRKYKANVHNQSVAAASVSATGELPEDERLIAKFREYEANMKKTYQKLKQWYERSQQQLTHSIKSIEQVSAVPKTLAQRQVLDNFRRDSKVFLTMINELESAMNDSNVENVSPRVPTAEKPAFKDVVILTERNMANRNRSPLKTLEIANIPARFSPIKSPLARSAFPLFPNKPTSKPPAPAPAIEIPPTVPTQPEPSPKKDLFGFETDDTDDSPPPATTAASAATPIKITKKTLKERLESVRKMLPSRPPNRTKTTQQRLPKVIEGPRSGKPRSVLQSVFAASTPVAQKRTQTRREPDEDVNLSAIADEPEVVAPAAPSPPPVALFDDVASSSMSAVNRTYSRVPRRNHKRKRNVYLADLGLSDDDDDGEEDEAEKGGGSDESAAEQENDAEVARKQVKKKRRVAPSKKKNAVEETNEFKQFVSEFNSMCEEVDRYKLVVEKPVTVRQRV